MFRASYDTHLGKWSTGGLQGKFVLRAEKTFTAEAQRKNDGCRIAKFYRGEKNVVTN